MTQQPTPSTPAPQPQTQETKPQETPPPVVINSTPAPPENQRVTEEQTLGFLKEMKENAGQISELVTEEENLVKEFFNFVFKILKPFGKTLEIAVSSLPERFDGRINKAYLYLTGQLVLVYKNGEVEVLNLADQENHEVLIEITGEVMMKLKSVINSHRTKTEKRVKFLMSVTKELQKVAEVFAGQ